MQNFQARFINKNDSGHFLSSYFQIWETATLNLTFAFLPYKSDALSLQSKQPNEKSQCWLSQDTHY